MNIIPTFPMMDCLECGFEAESRDNGFVGISGVRGRSPQLMGDLLLDCIDTSSRTVSAVRPLAESCVFLLYFIDLSRAISRSIPSYTSPLSK